MKTDQLIRTLAADARSTTAPMDRIWTMAALAAAIIAALVFFLSIGPRPDIAEAAGTVRFLFKFVATLTLSVTAFATLVTLARPGANTARALTPLLAVPALLLLAATAEIITVPSNEIAPRWLGANAVLCMTFIPLIGFGPLLVLLLVLRRGAPTRPSLSGLVAGLVAGGLAATFYAAHCTDDSPLFVATWYPLAVVMLAAIGAIASRLLVRW